jgi:hypothetical protein
MTPLAVAPHTRLMPLAPLLIKVIPLTLLWRLVQHLGGLKPHRKVVENFSHSYVLWQFLLEGHAFPPDEVDGRALIEG